MFPPLAEAGGLHPHIKMKGEKMPNIQDVINAWFNHQNERSYKPYSYNLESIDDQLIYVSKNLDTTPLGYYNSDSNTFCVYNLGEEPVEQNDPSGKLTFVIGQPVKNLKFKECYEEIKQVAESSGVQILCVPHPDRRFLTAVKNNDLQLIRYFLENPTGITEDDFMYMALNKIRFSEEVYDIFIEVLPQYALLTDPDLDVTGFILTVINKFWEPKQEPENLSKAIQIILREEFNDIINYEWVAATLIHNNQLNALKLIIPSKVGPNDPISIPYKEYSVTPTIYTLEPYIVYDKDDPKKEMIEYLVSVGGNPNIMFPGTNTPFLFKLFSQVHIAFNADLFGGIYTIFKKYNIDVNIKDEWNQNILHIVASIIDPEIPETFRSLLQAGVDPDHRALIDDEDKVTLAKIKGTLPKGYGKTPREMMLSYANEIIKN